MSTHSTAAHGRSTAAPPLEPAVVRHHDPVWVVQCGWSLFRLARLQELVRLAIVDLKALAPPTLTTVHAGCPDPADRDPIAEALQACCDELLDASGVAGAEAERDRHRHEIGVYISSHSPAWGQTFGEALTEYRNAAARTLESTFARTGIS